jgi:hypothetical protein
MPLDLTGQPLIDRSDFEHLKAAGVFGGWADQAAALHRDGYCTIQLSDSDFQARIERVVRELEPILAEQLRFWETGTAGSPRLQDAWMDLPAVRALALEPLVLNLLRQLYGREPFAFQTLNFAVGSEQHFHSDAVHFHSYPHGYMCGVWFALQDIEAESGPLHYFPGSHRLPYLSAQVLGLTPQQVAAETQPQSLFEAHWRKAVAEQGFQPERFLARRGDVLIWHANLLHGGEPVRNRQLRRWSQVVHYFFADCLYTTPMRNFSAGHGGACLRNPYDLATGRTRNSPAAWRALGLTNQPLVPPG